MSVRLASAYQIEKCGKIVGSKSPRRAGNTRGRHQGVSLMQSQRTTLARACAQCGASFTTTAGAVNRGRGKFCGHRCYSVNLAARRSPAERFWARVDRPSSDEACWKWTGGAKAEGYGKFWLNGRDVGAHVFSYELHAGPVPAGLWVLHTCDNPPCTNPAHLYAGTPQQNMDDKVARGRGRTPSGDRNGMRLYPDKVRRGEDKSQAKLTWPQVREIRRRATGGELLTALAREFGVDRSAVSRIVAGKSWPLRNGERPW